MIKIKLKRIGKKKQPFYNIIVSDIKNKKIIDKLGFFNPLTFNEKLRLKINKEKILFWKSKGAKLSLTVTNLLSKL